jgi:quercetin dioxygenase-like cupin family protein
LTELPSTTSDIQRNDESRTDGTSMTAFSSGTTRRSALQLAGGFGAAALLLPVMDRLRLFPQAAAETAVKAPTVAFTDIVYIPGSAAVTVPMAEWEGILGGAEAGVASSRVAIGKDVAKAPPTASHYESKTFQYPSGALRTLTFKKGEPVLHQVTFETSIYVVQGSVTLYPLYGHAGDPVTVNAGDALYMPSGMLKNPNPTEQTVLLLAQVGSTVPKPKKSVVLGNSATANPNLQWQEGGKDFSASKPEDIAKAPPNALKSAVKRLAFDGNSIRIASFKAGGKGNTFTITRTDVLIYIPQGRFRRTEGNQTFELKAGDTTREKIGNPGFWEPLEDDSVFIATDAPFDPAKISTIGIMR